MTKNYKTNTVLILIIAVLTLPAISFSQTYSTNNPTTSTKLKKTNRSGSRPGMPSSEAIVFTYDPSSSKLSFNFENTEIEAVTIFFESPDTGSCMYSYASIDEPIIYLHLDGIYNVTCTADDGSIFQGVFIP